MKSRYWIKLYHEILDDPKMGRLSDRLHRRAIEMFLMAGKEGTDGSLPPLQDMAWTLRVDPKSLEGELDALEALDIVIQVEEGQWRVVKFADRQAPSTSTERSRQSRERERDDQYYGPEPPEDEPETRRDEPEDADATIRSADRDRDRESDIDKEPDKDIESIISPPHILDFLQIRQIWIGQFPDKPKPRECSKSLQQKVKTRMKSAHFQVNWKPALIRASRSEFLMRSGFFTLGWFLKNDDNYEKCLNGNYDSQAQGHKPGPLNAMEEYQKLATEEGWDAKHDP